MFLDCWWMDGVGKVDGNYSEALDSKPALESHTKTDIFQCLLCEFSFDDQQRLVQHLMTHTVDKLPNYPCTKCHKMFTYETHLNAHMKVHKWEESNYSSSVKGPLQKGNQDKKDKVVAVVTDIQSKGLSATSKSKNKSDLPYMCKDCDLSFRREFSLKSHALMHKVEKPHQCVKCNQCFKTKDELQAHVKNHLHEKPYKCKDCDLSFKLEQSLKNHVLIHNIEKPHQCVKCNQCFKTIDELQAHAKDHVHDKPYSCALCEKSFGTRETLVGHFRIHTGKDLHQCSECGKMFIDKASLKKHQSVHD